MDQVDDSKIEPCTINIENWKIDSTDAINIAKNTLKNQDRRLDFNFVFLSGNRVICDGKEKWSVSLFDEEKIKGFVVEIDPYTGNILRSEFHE